MRLSDPISSPNFIKLITHYLINMTRRHFLTQHFMDFLVPFAYVGLANVIKVFKKRNFLNFFLRSITVWPFSTFLDRSNLKERNFAFQNMLPFEDALRPFPYGRKRRYELSPHDVRTNQIQ